MASARSIDVAERRARLGVRHHLALSERTDDVVRITDDLVALHSTDPVTVYLSAAARMVHPSLAPLAAALYDDHTLLLHHAMRRTLWVLTPEVARLAHAAATVGLVAQQQRTLMTLLVESGSWMGWNGRVTTAALAAAGAVAVDVDGTSAWIAAGDLDPVPDPGPRVSLLPSLDPTTMRWRQRDWFLTPEMNAQIFDRNGTVGTTIWADGRVVGGWAQRASGEIVTRPLTDVGAEQRAVIDSAAADLQVLLGDTRFTMRFPGPMHPCLLAGRTAQAVGVRCWVLSGSNARRARRRGSRRRNRCG